MARTAALRIDVDDGLVDMARLTVAIIAPQVASGALAPVLAAFAEHAPNPVHAVLLPDRQRVPQVRVCVEHCAAWLGAGIAA